MISKTKEIIHAQESKQDLDSLDSRNPGGI